MQQIVFLQQQLAHLQRQLPQNAPTSFQSSSPTPSQQPLEPSASAGQSATHPTPPLPSTHLPLKVAPPQQYDGAMDKADIFINQLILYFMGRNITNDHDKVICALSYMQQGSAARWARGVTQAIEGIPREQVEWKVFLKEFKEYFGDPNPQATAQFKISSLKQGSHTAEEFVSSFRELARDTGYNDVALVEKFKHGLNSSLVDKIYALPEMPTNLEGWISWACKLDRQWREREASKKTFQSLLRQSAPTTSSAVSSSKQQPKPSSTFNHASSSTSNLPAQQKQPDVVPMEVDSGWKSVRPPLICFKCRKPGHKAANCSSRVNINAMDHEALKAYYRDEILKEEAGKKDQPNFQ